MVSEKFFWYFFFKFINFCFNFKEKVSSDDIQRIARRFLSSPPSLAARGEIKGLPDVKDIQAGLLSNEGRLPGNKRLSLFR